MVVNQDSDKLKDSYDAVADEYVKRIFDELKHKPLDSELLDRFAVNVRDIGPVCDMGCGPGHVARYLHDRGVNVTGIDLSSRMVELARQLNPDINFQQGNMLSLDADDEAWGGILAFYCLIHIPREKMAVALQELKRILRQGGLMLLSFHLGREIIHLDELWEKKCQFDIIYAISKF